MPVCKACSAPLGEPDDGEELVCTACGVLADGAHVQLHSDAFEAGHQASGSSLAGFRIRSYRDPSRVLPGDSQASERHAANTAASHAFIHSLATHISASARAERATGIFNDLMASGRYRWGKSAQILACASLAVSLREANRPQSLAYIAHVANVSPKSLSRTFSRIQPLLRVKIPPSEPLNYIPTLHKHTHDLLQSDDDLIPRKMRDALKPHTQSALRLASSMAALALPPGAANTTAISIYILALEGALRAKLSHYRQLADHLRLFVNAGQQATYSRYVQLYEYLYSRLPLVPWLRQAPPPASTRNQRAKVDPRDIVARALHDLVKFDPSIPQSAPGLALDVIPDTDDEKDNDNDSDDDTPAPCAPKKRKALERSASTPLPQRKRPRLTPHDDAVRSLLVLPELSTGKQRWELQRTEKALSFRAHYMTCSEDALEGTKVPGRLALLASQRGGEAGVADSELFAEGELEGMLRTEAERDVVARAMQDAWAHQCKTRAPAKPKVKGTKALADWQSVLDGALAAEGFSQGERELVALLDDDDKAEPWDEDDTDRNMVPMTMDAGDWLLDY